MKKFLLFLVVVSLTLCTKVQASHVMGADLTYECIGPNQYRVTLTGYRDCNGITLDAPITISYRSAQCGVNSSINLSKVGPSVDITPSCLTTRSACQGGSGIGIEKDVFQGVLTLPAGCGNDWILSWTMCCRNTAITTLSNPGNEDFYIETRLNNTLAACNNSPTFSNNPVAVYCINSLQLYNQGAVDADGDSLRFYLMPSLNASGSTVAYSSGRNATNPLATTAGTTLDPATGQISFTPNQSQVGVIKVGVDEYRNGVLIGHVERDMQVIVTNCTNSSPTGNGINGGTGPTAYVYNTTACSSFCFTIQTSSTNAADSIYYSLAGAALPGATITSSGGNQPLLTICWSPGQSDVGSNTFILNLRNNACPYYGTASIAYTINVAPTSNPPVDAGPDIHLCQGGSATLTATSAGTVTSYTWSDGTTTHAGATWVVSPTTTTVYTVSALYSNGCTLIDQVVVYRSPKPTVTAFPPVSTICSTSDTVQITTISTNAATFQWTPYAGLTCSNCPNPQASPTVSTVYSVVALDSGGCASDTFRVRVNLNSPPPVQSCSVIYATPTGTGSGSQNDPTDLANALANAQCNNAVIKLAIGTYNVDFPIANIGSYTTIEGGFDPANNWIKSSLAGATTISRSALNVEGSGNTKRLVGIYLKGAQYFRFQDLTIQTANAPATAAGDTFGTTNYVIHMVNCSNYDFVRCQIKPGSGSNGATGANVTGTGAAGANGTAANGRNGATATPGTNAGGDGGRGGGGGVVSGNGGSAGVTGTGAGAGAGGAAGGGGTFCPAFGVLSGVFGQPGLPGTTGAPGAAGATGVPGTLSGVYFAAGGRGSDGTTGSYGSGGGGGGGSGGAGAFTNGGGGGSGGNGGAGGPGGSGGYGGGGCFGVFINTNGANGSFTQCNIGPLAPGTGGTGGAGGTGGTGGTGGAGNSGSGCNNANAAGGRGGDGGTGGQGGSGAAGTAARIYVATGTPLAMGDSTFALSAQPTIFAANISCTFRNDTLSSATSGAWNAGAGATVATSTGTQHFTQYTTAGRKDISYSANTYTGFVNIALNQSSFIPVIQSTASVLSGDTFYVCQGSTANFNLQIASADTFSWNFGGATIPNIYYGATQQNLTGLTFNTAGTYMVVANIKTSCCGWSPYDTAYILVEPSATITYTGTTSLCPGDSAHVILTGTGSGYQWSPVAGVSNPTGSDVYLHPLTSTNYIVTSLSPRGLCNADTTVPVTVLAPATLSFTTVPATCGSNGGATVIPSPAGTYTYLWNPTGSTSATISSQPSGNYSVTVTPVGSSCSVTGVATISTAGGVQAFITKTVQPLCAGDCNGQLKVRAIDGTAPYNYLWSNTVTVDSVNGLCAGTYLVTVTDANGCAVTASQVLTAPLPLRVAILDSTGTHCAGQCNGSATIDGQGGTGTFTFTWSPAISPQTNHPTNLCAGHYDITVVDQNGCRAVGGVTINSATTSLNVTFINVLESCPGKCNASSQAVINNGTPPYTYSWVNGVSQPLNANLCAGIYALTVTDSFLCPQTVQDTIAPSASPAVTGSIVTVPETCPASCDAIATVTVLTGTAPFTYGWSNGISTPGDSNLCANIYTLTVTDANTCSATFADTIVASPNTVTGFALDGNTNICGDRPDSTILTAYIDSAAQAQINIIWSTGLTATGVYSSQITVDSAGTYTAIAEKGGCRTTLTLTVDTITCDSTCRIIMANAFTPNGDGKNDVYKAVYSCAMYSYTLKIYNRWGQLVYATDDITAGWDGSYKGSAAASEVYLWFVCTKEKDVSTEVCTSGKLTLIR